MFRKIIAPIFALTLAFTFLTSIGLNYDTLSQNYEADKDYFIKSIPDSNLVVVEPNYGRFYHPSQEVEGDSSGDVLYRSLEDLGDDYEIKNTKMIRFERKGKMIPNLYVYVNPPSFEVASLSKSQ